MVKHLTLTFTGAVQKLSDAYATVSGVTSDQLAAADVAYQLVVLQPDGANAAVCYIGGTSEGTLTSANHGFQLAAGAAGAPPLPFALPAPGGGPIRASDLTVLGTINEKLHALLIGA